VTNKQEREILILWLFSKIDRFGPLIHNPNNFHIFGGFQIGQVILNQNSASAVGHCEDLIFFQQVPVI
jgi:hypothetical protein